MLRMTLNTKILSEIVFNIGHAFNIIQSCEIYRQIGFRHIFGIYYVVTPEGAQGERVRE